MYCYFYSSRLKQELTEQDLVKMQSKTKEIIDKFGLTGFLFYYKNHLVHYFEGDNFLVKKMYQLISEDKRLEDVKTLKEGPVDRRQFRDWSMHLRLSVKEPLFSPGELAQDAGGIRQLINDYYMSLP